MVHVLKVPENYSVMKQAKFLEVKNVSSEDTNDFKNDLSAVGREGNASV
jgi:hypothetical protein